MSTLEVDELEGFTVETDIQAALAHDPDVVIIATPSALHLDLAIPAAKQGCHLFNEKPLSNSIDKVYELKQVVEESGSKVLMGFQFRYHPNLIRIKELIREGKIGKPLSFRSHWGEYLPGWHPWEDYRNSYAGREDLGGGVVLTLCHNFDYLCWIFGEANVHSSLLGFESGMGLSVEDTADVSLIFDKGLFGSLHLNFTQRPARHTLEIIGTDGTIFWDYYQNEVRLYSFVEDGNLSEEIFTTPDGFERNDLFIQEIQHLIQISKGLEVSRCSLDDGIKALELCLDTKEVGAR
jgi:predicted dehydrogenase